MKQSMLGPVGAWLSERLPDPPLLSLRGGRPRDLDELRSAAREKVLELLGEPDGEAGVKATCLARYEHEGLAIEELSWRLPFGPPTEAIFLKPAGARGRLPGILALHDHAGRKVLGRHKIAEGRGAPAPLAVQHRAVSYGGRAWANELARRGYGVLVHDVFPFESRMIRYGDVPEHLAASGRRPLSGGAPLSDAPPRTLDELIEYDHWAAGQESVIAKSLFCSTTTWPGLCLSEDRAALGYLASRPDIDPERLGCGGLSGGGARSCYLAGTDARIKAALCVGFMTTWRDLLLAKSWTHTWMVYAPLLPRYLDFPDILALRAPLASLVQSCRDDALFTLGEVKRAIAMIRAVYRRAGAGANFASTLRPGRHQFSVAMQEEAFAFFDRWLQGA